MRKNQTHKPQITKIFQKGSRGFFWATRNRILFGYALILCFIFVVFVPAFREVLYARINGRVHRQVNEKMQIFKQLISGKTLFSDDIELDQDNETIDRLIENDNRFIKAPKTKEELRKFLDAFLGNQLPEDDTFLIMLWQGKFYKSSPRARPKELSIDSKIIRDWAELTQPKQGEKEIPGSKIDSIIYMAEPVKINSEVMGVFVIAHATGGERQEALEAVVVITEVSVVVLLFALVLAWLASGRILAPLNLLSQTVRKISETDLNQRITIDGEGELAELAATFNEMMDRLQAAFISQRNFINDAGHELRTPITIIRGHLELMGDDPKEVQETLTLVMDELERMNRFVNDLLLLAKAEQPDFLQLETIDVCTFTEELFAKIRVLGDGLRPTINERNWQLQATAKGKIVADRQRLTQAVMNLAQNATQHTNNTDTIALGSMIHQGKVSFWIRDTGEGIAPADQQRIFERFARATNSRRRSEGAGLGLSIVQAIAEAHGGQVTLKSQPGAGAIFTIILPVEPYQKEK
ncbi:Periplasmic Sensor Signal Transduction Histidine Kinase [Nostoc sp. NIES-3756]|uniref:sensor histidine kinase n=1 Tax=Nostoc sp. NIES-3756 TaxID=1751286 RepID=UPI000720625C|nr:HAMP domain-containing sensor histidine kinase [Nostoc sp. NIES-3756]BAT53976.1 Periplasmic Sensor Signal Transduction Histidine Kinase [Nostoc sp. NIES-3756]